MATKKVVRAYTDQDPFLKQLGLSDTVKSVMATPTSTISQMELDIRKALGKGLSAEQLESLNEHIESFALFYQPSPKHNTHASYQALLPSDKPLEVMERGQREEGVEGKFWFIKPPEREEASGGFRKKLKMKLHRKSSLATPLPGERSPGAAAGACAFGIPLAKQFELYGGTVPPVLSLCVQAVATYGLKSVGIFRLSANKNDLENLKTRFNSGDTPNIDDEHLAAALLKTWLRELPEPLCPFSTYPIFLALSELDLASPRFHQLAQLLFRSLPFPNRQALSALFTMIHTVVAHTDDNKMTPENLAVCLGPNICRPALEDETTMTIEASKITQVFTALFSNSLHHADLLQDGPPSEWAQYSGFILTICPLTASLVSRSAPVISPSAPLPPPIVALPPPPSSSSSSSSQLESSDATTRAFESTLENSDGTAETTSEDLSALSSSPAASLLVPHAGPPPPVSPRQRGLPSPRSTGSPLPPPLPPPVESEAKQLAVPVHSVLLQRHLSAPEEDYMEFELLTNDEVWGHSLEVEQHSLFRALLPFSRQRTGTGSRPKSPSRSITSSSSSSVSSSSSSSSPSSSSPIFSSTIASVRSSGEHAPLEVSGSLTVPASPNEKKDKKSPRRGKSKVDSHKRLDRLEQQYNQLTHVVKAMGTLLASLDLSEEQKKQRDALFLLLDSSLAPISQSSSASSLSSH